MSAHQQAVIAGRSFFPNLISGPFRSGLHEAFAFSIVACLVAAAASLMRGGRYADADEPAADQLRQPARAPALRAPASEMGQRRM